MIVARCKSISVIPFAQLVLSVLANPALADQSDNEGASMKAPD